MIVADYMPPPWWFFAGMFWQIGLPLIVLVLAGGLIDLGRWLERRKK